MGENNLKTIVGKSRVLEEQRMLEEQKRREKRRLANIKRRKKQRIKAIATLGIFLCIIAAGIVTIVKLLSSDNTQTDTENGTQNSEINTVQLQKVDAKDLGLINLEYIYECEDDSILERLRKKAEKNAKIQFVYDNYKAYPEQLLKALSNNEEMTDFVLMYPVEMKNQHSGVTTVSGMYAKGEMPQFIQWSSEWGYYPYGEDNMGLSGCGPTCLSMVAVALTGNDGYTPTKIAQYAMDNGYYYPGAGTKWDLFNEGVENFGLQSRTLGLSEKEMTQAIENGEYLVLSMGPGIFTSLGHYIVIYDYSDGEFLIKDPNSNERSATKYKYQDIENQIKNIWAVSRKNQTRR